MGLARECTLRARGVYLFIIINKYTSIKFLIIPFAGRIVESQLRLEVDDLIELCQKDF